MRNVCVICLLSMAVLLGPVGIPGGSAQTLSPLEVPAEIRLALPVAVPAVVLPVQRRDSKPLAPEDLHVRAIGTEGPGEVAVTVEPPLAVPNGATVQLGVTVAQPVRPGSYAVRLQVRDDTPGRDAVQELVTLRIEVAPAAIDAASLLPRTVTLLRLTPFNTASGTLHLSVRPTPAQGLPDLRADAGEVRRQAATPGADTALRSAPDALAQLDEAGPRPVAAGEAAPLTLHLSALPAAGEWRTDVTLRAATLQPVSFPVTVTVTDDVYLPTVVILLGVLFGLVVTAIRSDLRPRHAARQRLFGITQRLEALATFALDTGGQAAFSLTQGRSAAAAALRDLDLDGTPAAADAAATKVDTAIDALAATLAAAAQAVLASLVAPRQDLDMLRAVLAGLGTRTFATASETEQAEVSLADRALAAADAFAVQQRCGTAATRLTAAVQALDKLKREVVQRRIDLARNEADQPNGFAVLLTAAQTAIADRPINTAKFSDALNHLSDAYDLLPKRQGLLAIQAHPPLVQARPRPPSITCVPAKPSANTRVVLTVAQGNAAAPAPVAWEFGDGMPAVPGDARMMHEFAQAQVYAVSATLPDGRRGDLLVEVAASATDLALVGERSRLRNIDLALSLVAALVATAIGLQQLYFGKVFGSLADYTVALLWGFGIDQTVRGVADALGKFR